MMPAILEKRSSRNIASKISLYWTLAYTCARDRKGSYSDLVFSGAAHAVRILIFAAVYRVAFGSSSAPGFIAAIWAVSLSQTMFSMDRPPQTIVMGEDIKDGSVAIFMLRPMSYVTYSYWSYIGKSLPSILASAVACFSVAWVLTGELPATAPEFGVTLITAVVGVLLCNTMATNWGLLGFWTQDTSPFHWIDHKMCLLFGGLIIPLTLLPDKVQEVVQYTPWSAALGQPGALLTHFSMEKFLTVFVIQIAWLTFFCSLARLMVNKGMKKLVVLGG